MNREEQKKAFIDYEGDAWFNRNKNAVEQYSPEEDTLISLFKSYNLQPKSILEIGSSAGYRLNALQQLYPEAKVYGVEPSKAAVDFGKIKYPSIQFINTTADDLSGILSGSMDVVIVGFVFYIIDRELILKVVSEVDRILKNEGQLLIIDFYATSPLSNPYDHINNFSAYSFKQNYEEIFTASKLYHLLHKCSVNHLSKELDASSDFYGKCSVVMLKKDINASYR